MTRDTPIIVWFRRDLRISDNPALLAAVQGGRPLLPVYIDDPDNGDPWPTGAAGRWWLHHSLAAHARAWAAWGTPLLLKRGAEATVLAGLAAATGARAVFCNQVVEPWRQAHDLEVSDRLARCGVGFAFFSGSVLFDPSLVAAGRDRPWTVFGAFWRRCLTLPAPNRPLPPPHPPVAMPAPEDGEPAAGALAGCALADWRLVTDRPGGWDGLAAAWTPGEAAAQARLAAFLEDAATGYHQDRDRVDRPGTSQLSPSLHWGELSVRQVWHAVSATLDGGPGDVSRRAFLRQLGWREFATHLLHHFPELPHRPFDPRFEAFPSRRDDEALAAWQQGRTGYPLVDAAMRQMHATGWMHNRLRMVTASFLVKHLLLPWQEGAAWFWEGLVDADLANNSASWQWVAGCGTDAAPFFRIFNPVLQGRRFDPEGTLVRRFIPELAGLSASHSHEPWRARGASAPPGYPPPIVDLRQARERALAAFRSLPDRNAAAAAARDDPPPETV
jgi:deoxyribodipyrimidine photo-lyase